MFFLIVISAAACFLVSPAQGDSLPADIRYAAEFNHIPVGCRAAALGNAGVALPIDAASIFWNPAAASFSTTYELSGEYAYLYGGLSSLGCLALRMPLQDRMSVGLLYKPFYSGDINLWDSLPGTYLERQMDPSKRADGSREGIFTNYQNVLSLTLAKIFSIPAFRPASYAYPLPVELSAGLSFKGFWQTLNPRNKMRMGMNINCDVGLVLRIGIDYDITKNIVSRELYAGIAVKDVLGTSVVWLHSPDDYQESVDMTESVGVSFLDKTGILGANWVVTFALDKYYSTTYHAGIEAQYWDLIAFRIGISDQTPTIGTGIHYKGYFLDYAFSFDEVAYTPLRLSLGYTF